MAEGYPGLSVAERRADPTPRHASRRLGAFVVSPVHRFLHQQQPDSQGTPRVWLLHGPPILDLYLHNLYHGCVALRRTVELWGIEEWAGDPQPFTVTFTVNGELDFNGNADPQDARARFDAMRNPRPPRFGHRRKRPPTGASGAGADDSADETSQAAQQAAAATQTHVGGGRQLINRMQQIAAALRSGNGDRIIVIVDELSHQLERLESLNQLESVLQARQILIREWVTAINSRNALLVFLEFRPANIAPYLPPELPGVRYVELGGPNPGEVCEALLRSARRKHFTVRHADAVAKFLSGTGELKSALGLASRVVASGHDVTLERVIDLPPIDETRIAAILSELQALTGLQEVKAEAETLAERARRRRARLAEDGDFPDETLHMVFTGNPGTGKTTVARIFARLYHALGLLSSDKVIEVNAAEGIKSSTVGRTRENMQRKLDEALGGVLFIDEAHQFGDKDDPAAREAIEAIVPFSWNRRNNLVIVLAGYSERMIDFFDMDPGLPRRFPKWGRLEFADYTADQLWDMTRTALSRRGWSVDPDVETAFRLLVRRRSQRGGFGNAGGVDNLISEVIANHDARGVTGRTLTSEDLPAIVVRREQYVAQARRSLDTLVGLGAVRDMLDTLVAGLAYDAQEGRATNGNAYRMLFVGPPGTGKTSVARLMADLLYGEGAITRNAFVEVAGGSLQGEHLGESQAKVRRLFDEYRDGVVFIDEAYSICVDERDMYGRQVIDELVSQLTKPENSGTVVILAGYEAEMDHLLGRNTGLLRRFDRRVRFPNYTAEDCVQIAESSLDRDELTAGPGFLEHFRDLAQEAILTAGAQFGNAGWVRGTVAAAFNETKRRMMRDAVPPGDSRRRVVEVADLEAATGTARAADSTGPEHVSTPVTYVTDVAEAAVEASSEVN